VSACCCGCCFLYELHTAFTLAWSLLGCPLRGSTLTRGSRASQQDDREPAGGGGGQARGDMQVVSVYSDTSKGG
jgi:hypothetical protein